ncbi:hypothetical protein CGI23_25770, partial [Vibrio parahaemolyticus]
MKLKLLSYSIATVLVSTTLVGCGGEDGGSSPSPTPPTDTPMLSVKNGFTTVTPDHNDYVNLTPYVSAGAGDDVQLDDIQLTSDDAGCGEPTSSQQSAIGFETTLSGGALCEYQYTVTSMAPTSGYKTTETAIMTVVSTTDERPTLAPISQALTLTDTPTPVAIDLGAELVKAGDVYPTGYTLSEEVTLLGDGLVTVTPTSRTITYTPTQLGAHR